MNDGAVHIPAECGEWVKDTPNSYYNRVSHNGSLWLCIIPEGKTTTDEPVEGSISWQKQVSKCNDGADGKDGATGAKGDTGQTSYVHVKYSDYADGTGMNENGGAYIGTYVDFTPADSSDYTKYNWTLIEGATETTGAKGDQGIKGDKGDKGTTGNDGYSCSLTFYSTMLNSDSNGVIGSLAAAMTTVKLYQGSAAVTPAISIDSTLNCSASISGLNVSIVSVPNNTKSGYVDIKIVYGSFVKIERYTFTVVDYTVVKNYTQSIVGDQMSSYATKATVDALGNTVSDQSSTIKQNSDNIALKASKKDVSDLGDRMTSAEAKITPDAINLTVKSQKGTAVGNAKDEIKASFSIGTDGISMLGKKISLTGMVSLKCLSCASSVRLRKRL